MTIRVLLVDDDALVRAGLALMLGGSETIDIVGEVGDGRSAVDRVREGGIDLVLMDIRMPVLDGVAATTEIMALPNPPQVLVLTTFDADDLVVRALAAGASGFLLKDTPPTEIVAAIDRVAAGEPALSPKVTAGLIRHATSSLPDAAAAAATRRLAQLTEREREVAIAVGQGLSNAEIGTTLHMSLATVKAHLSHVFAKLHAANRVQVAIAVHEAGLLSD